MVETNPPAPVHAVNAVETKPKTAAELKLENDELEAQIIRRQKIEEMQRQGGKAVVSIPEAPKAESHKDYAARLLRGGLGKDARRQGAGP